MNEASERSNHGPQGRDPFGRDDTLAGIGVWLGILAGIVLIVDQVATVPSWLAVIALAAFAVGLVLFVAGAAVASRTTGRSFGRSLLAGLRAAATFVLDFA